MSAEWEARRPGPGTSAADQLIKDLRRRVSDITVRDKAMGFALAFNAGKPAAVEGLLADAEKIRGFLIAAQPEPDPQAGP